MEATTGSKYKTKSSNKRYDAMPRSKSENAFKKHDKLLIAMEKQNRILKQAIAREREEDQETLKREQGFSLYLNGANAPARKGFVPKHSHSIGTPRLMVTPRGTTSTALNDYLTAAAAASVESSEINKNRSHTAPEKQRRKYWGQGVVEIKSHTGDRLQTEPSALYSEDFDSAPEDGGIRSESSSDDEIEEMLSSFEESNPQLETTDEIYEDIIALTSSMDLTKSSSVEITIPKHKSYGGSTYRKNPPTPNHVTAHGDITNGKTVKSGTSDGKGVTSSNISSKPTESNKSGDMKAKPPVPVSTAFGTPRRKPIKKSPSTPSGNDTYNHRDTKSPAVSMSTSPNLKDTNKPLVKMTPKQKNHLEESWDSLKFFNHSQLGRLSQFYEPSQNTISEESHSSYEKIDSTFPEKIATSAQYNPNKYSDDFNIDDDEYNNSEAEFTIPMLPSGRKFVLNIHSTWGDQHYVGLNGIEFFSDKGTSAKVSEIKANPPDINILSEYSKDPRTFTNLINGVNKTCDDVNMWLVPFTAGASHKVFITFSDVTTIAMVRIWNYNKSRIHSHRGAREVTMTLDDDMIFCGEIRKASGTVSETIENFGDNVLFTVDEDILAKISEADPFFSNDDVMFECDDIFNPFHIERPPTGDGNVTARERPFTSAAELHPSVAGTAAADLLPSGTFCAKCVELRIMSCWDDDGFAGLTAVQVLGQDYDPVPFGKHSIEGYPKLTNLSLRFPSADVSSLINGVTITTDPDEMTMFPLQGCLYYVIKLSFVQALQISGLRVWNYNASFEESYKGVREIQILLDGRPLASKTSYLLRRAPGNVHYDFAQDVLFESKPHEAVGYDGDNFDNHHHSLSNVYEVAPSMPSGFVYKLELLDTWGDLYYIGLNGIQLFDPSGNEIHLTEKEIAAFPSSVNILGQVVDDVRTPDKLIDGVHDTKDGHHMWLAPILPGQINYVYIVFDVPTTISMVKIWNYAKAPTRGVRHFALLVDDLLIYNGILPKVNSSKLSSKSSHVDPHTVLFSKNPHLMKHIVPTRNGDQDIKLINNHTVLSTSKVASQQKFVDQSLRPMTSMTNSRKAKVKSRF